MHEEYTANQYAIRFTVALRDKTVPYMQYSVSEWKPDDWLCWYMVLQFLDSSEQRLIVLYQWSE